ncbi:MULTISPECIES: hypothetical protein [Clostridium]|uniref:Tranposon-transfer assisting protein n=1 Tax=Clostridium frigoriphilum TaxID=443253 RepID=A0ABU7UU90_9CLOT|nr:hypothetical protein [Clostridium sp. DSM 17811]MBU3102386.1 hypothetical protein [Clostridium sp. DSM 17811]
MKKSEDCTPYELTEITTELVAFLSKNMDANSLNLVGHFIQDIAQSIMAVKTENLKKQKENEYNNF